MKILEKQQGKGIIIAATLAVLVIIVLVILIVILKKKSGESDDSGHYKVNCQGFEGAKNSYKPGDKVELYYTLIATDTDYSFYIDDESYNAYWDDEKGGYKISFTMPEHDVTVSCKTRNSMVYIPDNTEGVTDSEVENTTEYEMTPSKIVGLSRDYEYTPEEGKVTIEVKEVNKYELVLVLHNNSSEAIYYGEDFRLEKKVNDEFVAFEPKEPIVWIDIAYELKPGEEKEITCSIGGYEDIDNGIYRVLKSPDLSAEFGVLVEWTE